MEEVVRSAPVIQEKVLAPQSMKVIKLDGGRVSIVDTIQLFGWTSETRFVWQLDRSLITLIAQEDGDLAFDAQIRSEYLPRPRNNQFILIRCVFGIQAVGQI